jgi:hypothetical protein
LGIFVAEKREKFESKLKDVLPAIENQFYSGRANDAAGKCVKAPTFDGVTEDTRGETDALVFHVLQLCKSMMEACPNVLVDAKYEGHVQRVAGKELFRCRLIVETGKRSYFRNCR